MSNAPMDMLRFDPLIALLGGMDGWWQVMADTIGWRWWFSWWQKIQIDRDKGNIIFFENFLPQCSKNRKSASPSFPLSLHDEIPRIQQQCS
jgi:hypothetical protein